jgi:hypothetical protein
MSSLRNLKSGDKVLIVQPPHNFEGHAVDGEVVSVENDIATVKFQADIIRTARFYVFDGCNTDQRLESFIVRA